MLSHLPWRSRCILLLMLLLLLHLLHLLRVHHLHPLLLLLLHPQHRAHVCLILLPHYFLLLLLLARRAHTWCTNLPPRFRVVTNMHVVTRVEAETLIRPHTTTTHATHAWRTCTLLLRCTWWCKLPSWRRTYIGNATASAGSRGSPQVSLRRLLLL